jgi:hypothetical protein
MLKNYMFLILTLFFLLLIFGLGMYSLGAYDDAPESEEVSTIYTNSFEEALEFCDQMQDPDYIPSERDPNGVYEKIHNGEYPEELQSDTSTPIFQMGQ